MYMYNLEYEEIIISLHVSLPLLFSLKESFQMGQDTCNI